MPGFSKTSQKALPLPEIPIIVTVDVKVVGVSLRFAGQGLRLAIEEGKGEEDAGGKKKSGEQKGPRGQARPGSCRPVLTERRKMVTDPENTQPIEELASKVLAALDRLEGRLEGTEVQLRRIEAEVLAAEDRSFRQMGSFSGLTATQWAAEEEWKRVESAGRRALERES